MARRTPTTAPDLIADMSARRPTLPFRAAGREMRSAMRRPCTAAPGRVEHRPPIRVCLTWLILAALVVAAGLTERAQADSRSLAGASPRGRKVRLHVGERQRFA